MTAFATTPEDKEFAASAVEFLDGATTRRPAADVSWGVGDEGLALFHETSGAEERAEADVAKTWQRRRWDAGFGWITGPAEHGGRALPPAFDRLYRRIEAEFRRAGHGCAADRARLGVADDRPVRLGGAARVLRARAAPG
ncbi:hypothetical protein [Actinophytocola sp.]|uniref:hypothetical protein n=1 Tax=Actinophytocola sp. TaxID=1872138 RepID=UPI0025C53C94|nr:hypothetical protein [Actinophytocola sp.]